MLPNELEQAISLLEGETQQALRLVVGYYEKQIAGLKREVVIVKQENERLKRENESLKRENKQLKDRLSKDSQNSNKPPSSDGLKKRKKTRSLRSKSGRKPGAQPGHKGTTLKMVAFADQVQHHRLDSCPSCCADLSAVEVHAKDRRQVFDLPKIKIEVSEHRIEGKCCPVCGEQAWSEYPPGVNSLVQYGPNIKALGVYLKQYQMISYQRACDLMKHLFGRSPCPGSLYNAERKAYEELATFEVQLRCRLIEAAVAGFDETSLRVEGTNHWLHLCSTDELALYHIDPKRGREAMQRMGVLPHFDGIAIHDFLSSYYGYDCEHGACNAHLLRELTYIAERFEQAWARQMSALLKRINNSRKVKKDQGLDAFSDIETDYFQFQYRQIIDTAFEVNPLEELPLNNRGKPIKTEARKLAERFEIYQPQILHFMWDFDVPFDNNRSERDLRMAKVKQKVSGCFRSSNGAQFFARIRSYIVSAQKQGFYAFDALRSLFMGDFTLTQMLIQSE